MTDEITGGPYLVTCGLAADAYHSSARTNYIYPNSGTSEGQFIFLYGAYLAYEALSMSPYDISSFGLSDEDADTAADTFLRIAQALSDGIGDGLPNGPMLRQPIPQIDTTLTAFNWLFAAKGDVQLNGSSLIPRGNAYQAFPAQGSVANGYEEVAPDTFRWFDKAVEKILQYDRRDGAKVKWSALRAAVRRTAVRAQNITDRREVFRPLGGIAVFNVPGTFASSSRYAARLPPANLDQSWSGYNFWSRDNDTGDIVGTFESETSGAYPIPNSDFANGLSNWQISGDQSKWFVENVGNGPAGSTGNYLVAGLNNPAVTNALNTYYAIVYPGAQVTATAQARGYGDKSDRQFRIGIFWYDKNKTQISFLVGPVSGWGNDGTIFCTGTAPANAAYVRVFIQAGATAKENRGYSSFDNVQLTYKNNIGNEATIGRVFEETWRTSTSYQDPDQFLYAEFGVLSLTGGAGTIKAYVRSAVDSDPSHRWSVDLQSITPIPFDGSVNGYLIPRTALINDADGTALPAGQAIASFGLTTTVGPAHTLRVRRLRLLSGPSAQWVEDNLPAAIRGAQMPYSPGAAPFVVDIDTVAQQIVTYRGSPFHGYQLPDAWYGLGAAAGAEMPSLGTADLPVPDASGTLTYPISTTTSTGVTKPANIMLMEQQVRFLADAQAKYNADRGINGPFAHTYVLNTLDRRSIGDPTPHTWVYTNDDPNTAWSGYQVRVVESLASLVYQAGGDAASVDVKSTALALAVNWLTWLNTAWPNSAGSPYKGMPTTFSGNSAPTTNGEDPHAAALVLRACLLLKLSGDSGNAALYDALMTRCWQYLETLWRTSGVMAFTWSPDATNRIWYGFWHGEIAATLGFAIQNAYALPTAVDADAMAARLILTSKWLLSTGVVFCDHDPAEQYPVWTKRPNWADGVIETLVWQTDNMVSETGSEQRRAVRQSPRRMLEASYLGVGAERMRMDLAVRRAGGINWLVPMWHDVQVLDDVAKQGSLRISVDPKSADYHDGGYALVLGEDTTDYERVKISSRGPGFIRLTTALQKRWEAGARVYPMRAGRFVEQPQVTKRSENVSVMQGRFQIVESNDNPGQEWLPEITFDGYAVFILRPNEADDAGYGYERIINTVDNQTGIPVFTDFANRAFGTQQFSFWMSTPDAHEYVRSLLYYLAGQQRAVWLPSFFRDLELVTAAVQGATTIDVENCGYTFYGGSTQFGRKEVYVETYDDDNFCLRISGSSEISPQVERLVLSTPLPRDIGPDDIRRISFMALSRGSSDSIEITHHTGTYGVSTAQVTFRNSYETRVPGLILSPSLPIGYVGEPYNSPVIAKGGTAPYTFAVVYGSLPPGLGVAPVGDTLWIQGTPITGGTFPVAIRATDANGLVGVRNYKIRVVPPPLKIYGDLPDGAVGDVVDFQYIVTGGVPPYTVRLFRGSLPSGLHMSGTGRVTGTLTTPGSYAWIARAYDSVGSFADVADKANVFYFITSRPYPLEDIARLAPTSYAVVGNFRGAVQPMDRLAPSAALQSGNLVTTTSFGSFAAPPESISPAASILSGNVVTTVSYGSFAAPPESIVSSAQMQSGLLRTTVINYTTRPEAVAPSASIVSGALT